MSPVGLAVNPPEAFPCLVDLSAAFDRMEHALPAEALFLTFHDHTLSFSACHPDKCFSVFFMRFSSSVHPGNADVVQESVLVSFLP